MTLDQLATIDDGISGHEVGSLLRKLSKEELVSTLIFLSGAAPGPFRSAFRHAITMNAALAAHFAIVHPGTPVPTLHPETIAQES